MSTGRVVPKLSSRAAAPAPAQQTQEEIRKKVIAAVEKYALSGHWEGAMREFACPYRVENGQLNIGSQTNSDIFWSIVGKMKQPIRDADIMVAVMDARDRFERKPVAALPPPPKPKPSPQELAREAHNRQLKKDRAMNDPSKHPIQGYGTKDAAADVPKKKENSLEEQARSEKAARENAIVNTALDRINAFQGSSHSRTVSGRAQLRSVFQAAMDAGQPAEAVLAAVEAETNKLFDSGSIR